MLETLLARLESVKKSGSGYLARCPAHADKSPSLHITQEGGKILIHCYAGCCAQDIVAAVGLSMRDLFEDSPLSQAQRRGHAIAARKRRFAILADHELSIVKIAQRRIAAGERLDPQNHARYQQAQARLKKLGVQL